MALAVSTTSPQSLLTAIKKAIDDKKVVTWRYEDIGGVRYYTHCVEQWDRTAWFKASTAAPGLVFNIVPPKGKAISAPVYAVYHGRLAEMLLSHFDKQFCQASASALPVSGDSVKAA